MRLAHFGTFDIDNYGDLLFPLILRRRLGSLAEEIVCAAPMGGPPAWDDGVPTAPLEQVVDGASDLDGIVVGGGDLLHAEPRHLDRYDAGHGSGLLAYPRLWGGAAELASEQRMALCWNAPGAPAPFQPAVAALLRRSVDASDYVAVRDSPSASFLLEAGAATRPSIVPDTTLEVSRLWEPEAIDEAYAAAFSARGAEKPARTIAIHLRARHLNLTPAEVAMRLDRVAERLEATIVFLALGPIHGDGELARAVAALMASVPLLVDRPSSLREAASLIGRSDAYLGSSLQGLVTACSFGVPSLVVADGDPKLRGFLEQFQLAGCLHDDWAEADARLPEILAGPGYAWQRVLTTADPLLDAHWERIESVLMAAAKAPRTRRRSAAGRESAAVASAAGRHGAPYAPILEAILRGQMDASQALERELAAEKKRAEALAETLSDQQQRSKALERELALAREQTTAADRLQAAQERRLIALEGELRGQLATERDEAAELGHRFADSEARAGALEDELATELVRRRQLAQELDGEQRRAAELAREAEGAREQAGAVEAELHDVWGELGSARRELESARAELEKTGDDAAEAHRLLGQNAERARTLEDALATERRRREHLAVELNRQLERNSALELDVSQAAERAAAAERRHVGEDERERAARRDREGVLAVRLGAAVSRQRTVEEERAASERRAAAIERQLETARRKATEADERLAASADAVRRVRNHVERGEASRTWRWGHRFFLTLRSLTLRRTVKTRGALDQALDELRELERGLDEQPYSPSAELVPRRALQRREAASGRRRRLKVSVICWDMGHNPLTRGNVLAEVLQDNFEVEIVGTLFERYGGKIWPPLKDSDIPMRTFPGGDFPEHFHAMEEFASTIDGDVIYVCKPRMASLGIGILAKEQRNRPLILDSDDRELSFFNLTEGIGFEELVDRRNEPDFLIPYGALWTQYCDSLIRCADHLTVSNWALHRRYGGAVIPHVRDERVFDPTRYDRSIVRERFGFTPRDRVILFAGTPRAHKGIQAIAEALRQIGDRRNKLCVIGDVTDGRLRKQLETFNEWLRLIPYQPFTEMPAILGVADLICVLQDTDSEVSRYQIPAKITDAIAMGIPCLTTRVPPVEPLIAADLVEVLDGEELVDRLGDLLDNLEGLAGKAAARRRGFVTEYSYAAARAELEAPILHLADDPPPLHADFARLLEFQRSVFGSTPPRRSPAPAPENGAPRRVAAAPSLAGRPASAGVVAAAPPAPAARARRPLAASEEYDFVFFWKQNDTGIYGRRQDMLVKYLAASERVHRVVHFDDPIDSHRLRSRFTRGQIAHEGNLVGRQTVGRLLGLESQDNVAFHTFLHRPENGGVANPLARVLPSRDEYPGYVASVLARYGIGKRKTIFWVYPRNFDFPELGSLLEPDLLVADVMDDQRTWVAPGSSYHAKLTRNYADILGASDLVITNCDGVRHTMREFVEDIHVVPNACELLPDARSHAKCPAELQQMKGPIVGYVGNLSSRIDVPLLERMARDRPAWNIVLIGSAHLSRDILVLDAYPNVHFLGTKRYESVTRLVAHFDVGIVPHLDNAMTQAMHPLKIFVYCGQNVPVVSTRVANVAETEELIAVADNHDAFVRMVDDAIATGRRTEFSPRALEILHANSWPRRVDQVFELLDGVGSGRT